jgi:FkbM family methyltransferase
MFFKNFLKKAPLPEKPIFHGQFSPPVDQILLNRYFFAYKRPGFFIECGGFDGITESCCFYFEKNLNWNGINIECHPFLYKQLTRNRPNSVNLQGALSKEDGRAVFTHAIHPVHGLNFGNGSLLHQPSHLKSLEQDGCQFERIEVPTFSYKTITEKVEAKAIDLFVLDVEGFELEVLASLSRDDLLPLVFCVETGHGIQTETTKKLESLGYRYDGTYRNNSFYLHQSFDFHGSC